MKTVEYLGDEARNYTDVGGVVPGGRYPVADEIAHALIENGEPFRVVPPDEPDAEKEA